LSTDETKLVQGTRPPGSPSPRTPHATLEELRQPAAQLLAEVVHVPFGQEVRLPHAFARAAVEGLFAILRVPGQVHEGPADPATAGLALAAGEWALRIPERCQLNPPLLIGGDPRRLAGDRVHVYPRDTVRLDLRYVRWLLSALEAVKPDELDPTGRPYPWVPPSSRLERLATAAPEEEDVTILGHDEPPPPLPAATPVPNTPIIADAQIHGWHDELSRLAGFPGLPLQLVRGADNQLGFTGGRIWLAAGLAPRRVRLVTCPNSDPAEILATIVHELAHGLCHTTGHGADFQRTMLALAGRRWGERWFAGARTQIGERCALVDRWLACGIRAALRDEGTPPLPVTDEEEGLLRVVTRIRRLRELAADQLGLPEAIVATAMANDLVTLHGLSHYGVRTDAIAEDELCDRWVVITGDGVWRRDLAHWIARACDVFSLAVQKTRMHFFGRYADVVQAEYLYEITAGRIEREAEHHLVRWRADRERVGHGEAVKERVSFCDSAAAEFHCKLERILHEERSAEDRDARGRPGRDRRPALEVATEFAGREHRRRGLSWGSATRRATRENSAGRELGRSLEVVRGIASPAAAPRQLPPAR